MTSKSHLILTLIFLAIMPALQGCLEDDSAPTYNYEEQLAKDVEIIDKYLKENNIKASEHATGLRYVIHEEGSGATPEQGDIIVAHYKGTLLNGEKFDSSYDRGEPYEFTIGVSSVIAGWHIGFSLLKEGSKATLYLPSGLAYGPSGQGSIGPNAVLVFDVELLSINKE